MNIRPDQDEIRLGAHRGNNGLSTGAGIVLAALILVAGLFVWEFIDDAIEQKRMKEAIKDLERTFGISGQPVQQVRIEAPRLQNPTISPQTIYRAEPADPTQGRKLEGKKKQALDELLRRDAERAAEIAAWNSPGCRFWWERNRWPVEKAKQQSACRP